eukprot:gene14133-33005_t
MAEDGRQHEPHKGGLGVHTPPLDLCSDCVAPLFCVAVAPFPGPPTASGGGPLPPPLRVTPGSATQPDAPGPELRRTPTQARRDTGGCD